MKEMMTTIQSELVQEKQQRKRKKTGSISTGKRVVDDDSNGKKWIWKLI